MQTKIQKWGNSLGLRIPRSFAAEAQVEEGATVDLSVEWIRSRASTGACERRGAFGSVPTDVLQETVGKILALVDPEGAR